MTPFLRPTGSISAIRSSVVFEELEKIHKYICQAGVILALALVRRRIGRAALAECRDLLRMACEGLDKLCNR